MLENAGLGALGAQGGRKQSEYRGNAQTHQEEMDDVTAKKAHDLRVSDIKEVQPRLQHVGGGAPQGRLGQVQSMTLKGDALVFKHFPLPGGVS